MTLSPDADHVVLDAAQRTMLAEIVERLALSTDDVFPVAELTGLVVRCHADLAGSPRAAMPELVERLARHRLGRLAAQLRAG